jgi:hypothetical protein
MLRAILALSFPHFRFGPADMAGALFAAPADYLDAVDLKAVEVSGMVKEDVQQEIFDCSEIPCPLLDMIGTGSCDNSYTEWTEDELEAPDLTNAAVSGADAPATATTAGNLLRKGNHTQICVKYVYVTERVQNVATHSIGDTLAYKTMRKMQANRRDIEAIMLSNQASVADNNNATAGKSAGLGAWITTHRSVGSGGTGGGFQTTKLVTAYTPGARRALTWELIADQIEGVYNEGSNPTVLMSVPGVTKRLARFLFTTSYAAIPTANVEGTGGGATQTSQGYIDTFRTDFGFTMKIVPNRLQQEYEAADTGTQSAAAVFGFDLDYLSVAYLHSMKIEPLAKLGLSHRRMISADWTQKCLLERAHFVIHDINSAATVTAT